MSDLESVWNLADDHLDQMITELQRLAQQTSISASDEEFEDWTDRFDSNNTGRSTG